MSCQGTWADAIIIQAVANSLNLSINIVESNPAFAPITVVEAVNVIADTLRIYIGHIDEIHYVSTSEIHTRSSESQASSDNKNQAAQKRELSLRNEHVREIKRKSFRKRKANNSEHIKEINKRSIRKRTANNPEHVREINKQSVRKRTANNPDHVREVNKQSVRKRMANNPEHVREINKRSVTKRKADMPEKVRETNKECSKKRKASKPQLIKQINRNYKEKLKRVSFPHTTINAFDETPFQDLSNASQLAFGNDNFQVQKDSAISIINLFHKNIANGPEYVCTCCDQWWYKSSVMKSDTNKYRACSQDIVKSCLTGFKSVNDTEWICITCDSNLKKGKIPSCSKANKMGFPDKPDVLNLTSLEERLISPRIPFMQIRELPRGGQLSIHGNVVNVPSDVNSTVHCLPRPMSESQTIPIKLKRRLSYKHHYQF